MNPKNDDQNVILFENVQKKVAYNYYEYIIKAYIISILLAM